jgi:DNA-binding IclR family transcriptional regulator
MTPAALSRAVGSRTERVREVLDGLVEDGFLTRTGMRFTIS